VRGIRLRAGDEVVDMTAFAAEGEEAQVMTISENGFGKRTPVEEYRITNRGGVGIRNMKVTSKTGPVAGVKTVTESDEMMLMTEGGKVLRAAVEEVRQTGRDAMGVRTLHVDEGDCIASVALLPERADDGDEPDDFEDQPDDGGESGPDEDEAPGSED
jgi:DNA gyrase subunit A